MEFPSFATTSILPMKKKRVNCRAKGRRHELEAQALLEKGGWLVEITKPGTKFEKNKDFFHLFDLIAIKKINGVSKTRWIQVKTNGCPKKVKEQIIEFKEKYLDSHSQVEVLIKYDRKGWKKIIL